MHPTPANTPAILTIAGSDCSGGAGLQADLKTFQHFQLHGLTAVTCIVSETANIVRRVEMVSAEMIEDQIRLLMESTALPVVKLGMLGSTEIVSKIAQIFAGFPATRLVIDPVMVASTGESLLEQSALRAYQDELLPLAYIITPNLPEAEVLFGSKIESVSEMTDAAQKLSEKYECAVLLKGGHLKGPTCVDILHDGSISHELSSPRLKVSASHGTGCTLAAAVAAQLALGHPLLEATQAAKSYLEKCLSSSYQLAGANPCITALNQGTLPFPS